MFRHQREISQVDLLHDRALSGLAELPQETLRPRSFEDLVRHGFDDPTPSKPET
jgi:hypothetical protein